MAAVLSQLSEHSVAQNPYKAPVTASFGTRQRSLLSRRNRALWIVSLVACAMPLIYYLYVLLFWLVASVSLGEWARPGMHDPKSFLYCIPYHLSHLHLIMAFAVAPLVVAIGLIREKVVLHTMAYAISLTLSIALSSIDYSQVTTWIAD